MLKGGTMKDWRSWAWLSFGLMVVGVSICLTIAHKHERDVEKTAIKAGYEKVFGYNRGIHYWTWEKRIDKRK